MEVKATQCIGIKCVIVCTHSPRDLLVELCQVPYLRRLRLKLLFFKVFVFGVLDETTKIKPSFKIPFCLNPSLGVHYSRMWSMQGPDL